MSIALSLNFVDLFVINEKLKLKCITEMYCINLKSLTEICACMRAWQFMQIKSIALFCSDHCELVHNVVGTKELDYVRSIYIG